MTPLLRLLLVCALAFPAMAAESPKALIEEAKRIDSDDPARALQLIARALSLIGSNDRALRLEALKAQCAAQMAAAPEAILPLANASLAEARAANDPSALSSLHVCRGVGFELAGQSARALADYETAVREGRRSPNRTDLAEALVLRGEMFYYSGRFSDALPDLQAAYQIFASAGKKKQQFRALSAIASLYSDSRVGQYDRAIEYYRQVLAFQEETSSLSGIATAHYNLGSTFERQRKFADALEHFRKALAIEEQRGDQSEAAYVRRSIGIVLTKMDRAAEALPVLDRALGYFEERHPDRAAMTHLSRGVTLNKLRRFDAALRDLEIARAHYEKEDNTRFLEKVQEERAIAFEGRGDWRGAAQARAAQLALERRLATQLRDEHTARMRVQFDAEKKEAENRALLREREDARRIRSLQTAVIVLGAAILLILAALVVRSILKARRLRAMAMTDELTRLPNRRALLLFAEEQLRRHQPFALVALDIDHFKQVNDTHGHDAGDEVLRRVAETCRAALRRDDRLGRTGGEEFIAVLPRTTAAVAMEVAERLRAAVATSDAPHHVTISLGVSEWTEGDTFATMSKRADESLYRAKERGRNRVELAVA